MIVDFNSSDTKTTYKSKICIVGSGVIGLTILSEFLNLSNLDVLVVESGGCDINNKLKSLDEVVNTGEVESGVEHSRARVFGGTSALWGGQVLPFSWLDFESRDWVNKSGWPINFNDLENHYQQAANLLSLDNAEYSENYWQKDSDLKPRINDQLFRLTYSKWSPKPNLGLMFKKDIEKSKQVRLLINANVMQINSDNSSESVKTISLKSLSGNYAQVEADIFILCCGGIDNARILLASDSVCKNGLGNKYGNVGRFYQDHIGIYGGRLIPKNFELFEGLFSTFLHGKQKYLPKLVLSEEFQKTEKLLNVNANISIQAHGDSPLNYIKDFYSTLRSQGVNLSSIKSLMSVFRSPIELLRILNSYYLKHRKYFPKDAGYFLIANCETEPDQQSYLKLSKEKDILGMPKAEVNWEISGLSQKTILKFYELANEELSRLEIAEVKIRPELYESTDDWKRRCYSLYHHMGSTRMSSDPKLGVVDSDCKVHGTKNLYIAGTSVFATSGCANPTFTAMALAIRLADHIKEVTKT